MISELNINKLNGRQEETSNNETKEAEVGMNKNEVS